MQWGVFTFICGSLLLSLQLVAVDTEPQDSCKEPKLIGWCKGSFHRIYYNQATGKCEEFIYGGCKGNANNFASRAECVAACEK